MPRCECGTYLSPDYVRVLLPDDAEEIPACLECSGAGVRYGGDP